MSAHTPGPWFVGKQSVYMRRGVLPIVGQVSHGPTVAIVMPPRTGEPLAEIDRANARLIAAAPDLLAALEAEDEWRERDDAGELDPAWDYEQMVGDKRRAAIAKATAS